MTWLSLSTWSIHRSVNVMSTLGQAIALAAKVHQNQLDKGGKAYILHPIRVMMRLRTDDEELMIIAILHDVVEDSGGTVNLEDLYMMGFSVRVIAGVDALTRRSEEDYTAFIKRCATNPDGRLVKRDDIKDNSDVTRLKGLRKKDFERLERYCIAYEYLKD